MKIIAFYLPQFHRLEINDKNRGEGYTEWENVKKAKSLYRGHVQPKIPLKNYYYNLENIDTIKWQCELANQYGIYGFCFYHYWFNGKPLMEKPIENLLKNSDIKIKYCLSWANESWYKKTKLKKELILEQKYGDQKEWEKHCRFLLPYFLDQRYIRMDGKPILIIYRPEIIDSLEEMLMYISEYMRKHGVGELCYIYQYNRYNHQTDKGGELFSYGIEYQPTYSKAMQMKSLSMMMKKAANLFFSRNIKNYSKFPLLTLDYDSTWKRILEHLPNDSKMLPGAFVNWDNTPRYGKRGSFYLNYSAEKFAKYLELQIKNAKNVYKKDFLFLFAWNEWGEGGYLEPDEQEGYARLEAVKKALEKG